MKSLLIALLLCGFVSAQEPEHKFFDKTARFSLAGSAAAMSWDNAQTCWDLGQGSQEKILPLKTCVGLSLLTVSSIGSQVGSAYLLHRSGHHRLERIAELAWLVGPAIGLTYTYTHRFRVVPVPVTTVVIPVHSNPSFCIVGSPGC